MSLVRSLVVVFTLFSLSSTKPFRLRGTNSIAPYSNFTSISTSLAAAQTVASSTITSPSSPSASTEAPPYPITAVGGYSITNGTGGRPQPTDQGPPPRPASYSNATISKNLTSPSCTVNIPNANVDWWYAATYEWPVGTLVQFDGNFTDGQKYLSNVPNTETFNVTSAILTDFAYTNSESYDSDWGFTWTFVEEYTVKPSAVTTSVVTRNAARPLPAGNVIPATDTPLYDVNGDDLPSATFPITGAAGTVFAATSATPVLYFSTYEVEYAIQVTADGGRVSVSTATSTISLPDVSAFSYWVRDIEDLATATGAVPDEFLQQIPQSSCAAGNIQATVTVLVVVDYYYLNIPPPAVPFIVHIESTALGFGDPTDDPTVVVQETGIGDSNSFNVPVILPTANGFSVAPTEASEVHHGHGEDVPSTPAIISQAGQTGSAATGTQGGEHNAGGSPGQVPNPPDPSQVTVGTLGTAPVVIGPSSVVEVGSQTVTPGGPAITVGGVPVSLVPSGTAIVVGGVTSSLPRVVVPVGGQPLPPPVLTIGSSTLTGNAATQFFISPGQTLTPGGTATVDGTVVSLGPSASFIVVGGSTQVLPTAVSAPTPTPQIVVGGATFTPNPGGSTFVIDGQTLAPGQQITVAGTAVSLGPSASFAVVGGSTQLLSTGSPAITPAPTIVVGGSTFTASPSGSSFVINGQTLTPGQAITVDGTTVSLGPSASFVVINGATSTFANPAALITPPPLTIGNGIYTALPGSGTTYVIGGSLLTPGGVITVGGTTISLAPGATALIVNGQTTTLSPQAGITNPPLLTVGSQTYTALEGTGTTFVISGQTLTPGGVITVDGTTISLAPGATELIYGSAGHSTTETLFPATTTRSQSITGTGQASAKQTGVLNNPTQTSSKGAGHHVQPSGFEGWVLSALVSLFGLLVGGM